MFLINHHDPLSPGNGIYLKERLADFRDPSAVQALHHAPGHQRPRGQSGGGWAKDWAKYSLAEDYMDPQNLEMTGCFSGFM